MLECLASTIMRKSRTSCASFVAGTYIVPTRTAVSDITLAMIRVSRRLGYMSKEIVLFIFRANRGVGTGYALDKSQKRV
jgi:hypothetical protein